MSTNDEVLIRAENVSKKFCRNLKQGMLYSLADMGSELMGKSRNLNLRKNEFLSTNDVSFEIRRGEVVGLIGHNGAGKTTLLKMINGLFPPDAGQLTVRGRVGALIALGAGFNPILSGRENVFINAAVLGIPRKTVLERFDEIVAFAELEKFIDAPVQSYSSGMQARLGFAVASHLDPDVLLVDEILSVGDISFRSRCFKRMGEIKENGTAIVFVTHNMHQVSQFCTRAMYLRNGGIVSDGLVSNALDVYTRDQNEKESESDGRACPELVEGSSVSMTNVRFEDSQGGEISGLENVSDHAFLAIEIENRSDEDTGIVLDVVVRDRDGVLFQGVNIDYGVSLQSKGNGRILVRVPLTAFNSINDTLDFALAVWDANRVNLLSWRRGFKLACPVCAESNGRMSMSEDWKWEDLGS